jgi:hypothetical protein
MKVSLVFLSVALQSAVMALPVTVAERSPANPFAAAAAKAAGGRKGESPEQAASAFAGDVAIVSSSLNGSKSMGFYALE